MYRNKKGFTLVELIISMAIFSIVMGTIYFFFITNYKILNKVSLETDIQTEAEKAIEKITYVAMESSDVEINKDIDGKIKNSTGYVLYKNGGSDYVFRIEDHKLMLAVDASPAIQVANFVEYIICNQITITNNGVTKNIGIDIEIAFELGIKENEDKIVKDQIYFRN
ncbi:PilW family protein [Clostridium sp.]|uniref:PilW family protein n=1 Tax=Clostridium sp. TaxID=1506 RepID=UPI003D6C9C28